MSTKGVAGGCGRGSLAGLLLLHERMRARGLVAPVARYLPAAHDATGPLARIR